MKKSFLLFFFFASLFSSAQNKDLGIHLGCYSNGDSLTLTALKRTSGINILGNGSENCSLKQWNLKITLKNKHQYTYKPDSDTPNQLSKQMKDVLLDKFNAITSVVIKDIVISYMDKVEKKQSEMNMDSVTFYLNDKAFKKCDEKTSLAKDDLILKFSCFKNGQSASVKDLLHYPSFSIINFNPKVDIKIISFNFAVPKMDERRNPNAVQGILNSGIELNAESYEMVKKLVPGEAFVLNNITVEFSNKKTKSKETAVIPSIEIPIERKSSIQCGDAGSDTLFVLEYSGKLLTGKDKSKPLVHQKVYLKDSRDSIVQTTFTNSYGDFTFKYLNADEAYLISIPAEDNGQVKDNLIHLAKVDGTIVKTLEKSGNTFVYKVLPVELSVLAKEVEEDTELKIRNFGTSTQKELTVIEDIYYAPNSAEISDLSQANLNKIVNAMTQNLSLKLAISSHTDANGDDAYNMTLSEKRAKIVQEYFLSKGISKDRLTAKGYGETMIKNRCKNGVDCSELEHELNRRTEFKFTK